MVSENIRLFLEMRVFVSGFQVSFTESLDRARPFD